METADLIQNAQPGEVAVSTDRWISFNRKVFDAMRSRPDLAALSTWKKC